MIPKDLPPVRGALTAKEPLAPFTWFRVGGPADLLFLPADEEDLAVVLAALPAETPVTVLGVGSNVIVRDGGIEGLVVRLAGKAFAAVEIEASTGRLRAGAAALDAQVARAAAKAGLAGLEFYAGIPGSIGGALTMNAGCYGRETKDALIEATGIDRSGARRTLPLAELALSYRRNPRTDLIWTGALYQGAPDAPAAIEARMAEITASREASQPIREKTGGSTFKNPPGESAWKLIDAAGLRGFRVGGAQVSEKHCNFLINTGEATAADIENLGEEVRARVRAATGVELEWEIKRIGRAAN